MGVEGGSPYNAEAAIQNIIDHGNQPTVVEEGSTTGACIEDSKIPYSGDGDFEPILEPTYDENGNQTGWEIPENEDPDNLCPTQEEINKAY